MRIVVYHKRYGCETGCCGHSVRMEGGREEFMFDHPYNADPRKFAEDLVREVFGEEHTKDLDWENCIIEEE